MKRKIRLFAFIVAFAVMFSLWSPFVDTMQFASAMETIAESIASSELGQPTSQAGSPALGGETTGPEITNPSETNGDMKTDMVTITFDTHGGEPIASIDLSTGSSLDAWPVAMKEEFVFVGWSLTEFGEALNEDHVFAEDTILHALWKAEQEPEGDFDDEPDEGIVNEPLGAEGDGIETYPVYIDYNVGALTTFPSRAMRRMARGPLSNNPPIIGTDHPEDPGEVMLFKEARSIDDYVNTWEVTVRIEAMDTVKTSDIVLVIDRSYSMNTGNRFPAAIAAAKSFVAQMTQVPGTRIAVISYGTGYEVQTGLTDNKNALDAAIDNIPAPNIGTAQFTHTQAGIRQASAILNHADSDADFKHIVLLSDGDPTRSYGFKDADKRRDGYDEIRVGNRIDHYETGIGYLYGDFDEGATVGSSNAALLTQIEQYPLNQSGQS